VSWEKQLIPRCVIINGLLTPPRSVRRRVYETVWCPSVCPFVCLSVSANSRKAGAAGLLPSRAGERYRSIAAGTALGSVTCSVRGSRLVGNQTTNGLLRCESVLRLQELKQKKSWATEKTHRISEERRSH